MLLRDDKDELLALRKKVFLTGYKGGLAHLASCFSCMEIIYTLYLKGVLRYDSENSKWEDRDRFVLSKGHAGLTLYACLERAGLISSDMLDSYLKEGGLIGGEPCMRDCEWVEATTGSLGHGLSMAVGMAMALKLNDSPAKVYVLLGDGECEEGTIWEAAMSAAAFKLDNLVAILDCNKIQKMDFVEKTIGPERWRDRFESFGWSVREVDGHNVDELKKVFSADSEKDKPGFVIANTIKGKGVTIMENSPNWHFKLPNKKELVAFKEQLGVSDDELR